MLYSDRGYCIAHARSTKKEALGRAPMGGGGDDHAKEDKGVPESLGAGGAGRGVPAIRLRRLRRAK